MHSISSQVHSFNQAQPININQNDYLESRLSSIEESAQKLGLNQIRSHLMNVPYDRNHYLKNIVVALHTKDTNALQLNMQRLSYFYSDTASHSQQLRLAREAIVANNINAFKSFIATLPDINALQEDGLNLLHFAASQGQHEAVQTLLEAGALPLIQDNELKTACYHAIKSEDVNTFKTLLNTDIDVNACHFYSPKSKESLQLLHLVVDRGNMDLLTCLLEHKPDINAFTNDSFGHTPLSIAVSKANHSFVEKLVDAKADPDIANSFYCQSAFEVALYTLNLNTINTQKQANAAKCLALMLPHTNEMNTNVTLRNGVSVKPLEALAHALIYHKPPTQNLKGYLEHCATDPTLNPILTTIRAFTHAGAGTHKHQFKANATIEHIVKTAAKDYDLCIKKAQKQYDKDNFSIGDWYDDKVYPWLHPLDTLLGYIRK